jgi:DNA repair protein RecO (recombination protein O)
VAAKRVTEEPAYVLHRYDWSESSLILEVFTRHHGRIALVAKGVEETDLAASVRCCCRCSRCCSSFGGDAEVRTLKACAVAGRTCHAHG